MKLLKSIFREGRRAASRLANLVGVTSPALGIDLGTQNTVVCRKKDGKVLVNEPTLVAQNKKTGRCYFGKNAENKIGIVSKDFEFFFLLKDGTIQSNHDQMVSDFLHYIIKKACFRKPDAVFAVSCRLQERDLKSLDYAAKSLCNSVAYIYQPFGAILGSGVDPLKSQSLIVYDIGHGTTDGLAISNEDNVYAHAIPVGGSEMDQCIIDHMGTKGITIDGQIARRIKHEVGCAMTDRYDHMHLPLRSLVTDETSKRKFADIDITDTEICEALEPSVTEIARGLEVLLEQLSQRNPMITTTTGNACKSHERVPVAPQKVQVYLGGGVSLLRRLNERLAGPLDIQCNLISDPLDKAALGAAICVNNHDLLDRYGVDFQTVRGRDFKIIGTLAPTPTTNEAPAAAATQIDTPKHGAPRVVSITRIA